MTHDQRGNLLYRTGLDALSAERDALLRFARATIRTTPLRCQCPGKCLVCQVRAIVDGEVATAGGVVQETER